MGNLASSNRVNTFCGHVGTFKQYLHECKLKVIIKMIDYAIISLSLSQDTHTITLRKKCILILL
jgi:hypothetical protein